MIVKLQNIETNDFAAFLFVRIREGIDERGIAAGKEILYHRV